MPTSPEQQPGGSMGCSSSQETKPRASATVIPAPSPLRTIVISPSPKSSLVRWLDRLLLLLRSSGLRWLSGSVDKDL